MRGFLQSVVVLFLVFAWNNSSAQITQTVKGGQASQPINFSGGCSYHWVNDNPSIGLPASGDGNIPSFTALNDGSGPVTANIKVTPVNLGIAYIPSLNDRNVSVVDIAAQKLIKTIPLGDQPYGACVSPDGKFVYVVNGYVVSVISTETNTVIGTIPANAYGYDVVISPDGTKLYLIDGNYDQILVFDAATYALIKSIPCGHFPLGLTINSDESRIYVADENVDNQPGADAVTVISTVDYSIIATVRIGTNTHPWGIDVSPNGKMVYTGNNSPHTMGVIDAGKRYTRLSGMSNHGMGCLTMRRCR